MKKSTQRIVAAVAVIVSANAVSGETTSRGTQSTSRMVDAEWIAFRGKDGRGVLNAVRIVNQDGVEGSWVGDAMRGLDKVQAAALLGKVKGLDVTAPEAAWYELEKLDLPLALRNALDIAIWDLHGRVQGLPVGKLLGPAKRDRVKFYMSGFPNMTHKQNVQAVKDAAERKIQAYRTYSYLKGHGPARTVADAAQWLAADIALARAVKAVTPAGVALEFYPGLSYSVEQALQVGAVLDELGYAQFVDPLPHQDPTARRDYQTLREKLRTPLCAPLGGSLEMRLDWLKAGVVDVYEIDLYAGFTPCLRMVRACEQAGVPLDLHGGFPMDFYQFPLYGFVGDDVLPFIGWHGWSPKGIAVATEFKGGEARPERQPWIKRVQTRPVDAEGYVHVVYEIPGMGAEPDWEWIEQQEIK